MQRCEGNKGTIRRSKIILATEGSQTRSTENTAQHSHNQKQILATESTENTETVKRKTKKKGKDEIAASFHSSQ